MGRWFGIARLPNSFQSSTVGSVVIADYTLMRMELWPFTILVSTRMEPTHQQEGLQDAQILRTTLLDWSSLLCRRICAQIRLCGATTGGYAGQ
uniref:Uncharacterized protein n=1 Tax=Ditylenchus dipsaci TaxID=166011 RepID=A0A915D2E8_9BILA